MLSSKICPHFLQIRSRETTEMLRGHFLIFDTLGLHNLILQSLYEELSTLSTDFSTLAPPFIHVVSADIAFYFQTRFCIPHLPHLPIFVYITIFCPLCSIPTRGPALCLRQRSRSKSAGAPHQGDPAAKKAGPGRTSYKSSRRMPRRELCTFEEIPGQPGEKRGAPPFYPALKNGPQCAPAGGRQNRRRPMSILA